MTYYDDCNPTASVVRTTIVRNYKQRLIILLYCIIISSTTFRAKFNIETKLGDCYLFIIFFLIDLK